MGQAELFAKPAEPAGLFRLEVGRDFGRAVIGVEGGPTCCGTRSSSASARSAPRSAGGVVVAAKGMLAPELSYRGAYGVDGDKGPANGELLAGLRLRAGPVEVFGLGGPGFFNRFGTPQWRALAGLAFRSDRTPPPPRPIRARRARRTRPSSARRSTTTATASSTRTTRARRRRLAELKGCPAKDTDGDRVPDHLDKCPTEPGPADNQGCPRVVVQPKMVELREKVQFDTGKATLKPESGPLLDEIANVLRAHPEVTSVVIEGHTDSTGGASFNQRLSQARADAVMEALVDRGVEKERLSAKGFGPTRPIASNDTPEGRERTAASRSRSRGGPSRDRAGR